jgi:hypothetical protein
MNPLLVDIILNFPVQQESITVALNLIDSVTPTINRIVEDTSTALGRIGSNATIFNGINNAVKALSEASGDATTGLIVLGGEADNAAIAANLLSVKANILAAAKGVATGAISTKTAATFLLVAAKKSLKIAMLALPFIAVSAAIAGAVIGIGRWIGSLFRSKEAMTSNGDNIEKLSETYGRSTEEIEADMERMGTTSLDEWESMEQSVRAFAEQFGKDVDEARDKIQELSVGYEQLNGTMAAMQSIGEQFGMSMGEVSDALERQGISMDQVIQMTPELAEGMMDAALQIDQLVEAYDAAHEAALASIQGQIGLFGELNMETEKTTESMMATWNQQADAADKHAANLEAALAFGLAPELVDAFNDIEHAAELNALIEEMEAAGAAFVDGEATMTPAAQAIADGMEESFNRSQEAQNQLAHTMAEIETDFTNSVDNIIETIEGLDLASETTQHGAEALNGLIEGIQSREGAAAEAMNGAGEGALNALQAAIPESATSGTGSDAMGSFLQGILSRREEILAGVRSITSEVSSLLDSAIASASSRRFTSAMAGAAQGFTHNLAFATPGSDARYQLDLGDKIDKLIDTVAAGQNIIMDTGELVGATYPNYDCTAGSTISYNKRWGR